MAKPSAKFRTATSERSSVKGRGNVIGRSAISGTFPGTGSFVVRKERISKLGERGFSKIELHKLVAPPRTLARRHETLSLEESDRVQRLERTIDHATRVFGSEEKANKWLRTENRALNNAVPIDLLVSETGAHQIEMQLHAIDYGIYA